MGLDYSQLRPISSQFPFIYNVNTLYQFKFPLCIKQYIIHPLSMKVTLQQPRAHGQPHLYYPKRRKPPCNQGAPQATLLSQTTLQATWPGQTNITGGKLVRHYNTPSSTKVLPEEAPDKTHQTTARPEPPIPKPKY